MSDRKRDPLGATDSDAQKAVDYARLATAPMSAPTVVPHRGCLLIPGEVARESGMMSPTNPI